ncbi:DUF2207 domain-containing protein [Paenibacillus sp. 1P07SE]|uniref:DUF2207 domain-containing protein n=1 Tax=Paenibacillus sp. 1P07SE TaxID=3132209 RepID=UPI0039A49AB4
MNPRSNDGRKGRSNRIWAGWLLVVLLFTVVLPGTAAADSFEIELVEIDARLDAEGHMHVTEYDTYVFDGSFNGIVVRLDSSGSDGIADFQAVELTESGEELPLEAQRQQDTGDVWEYRVFSASEDETKQFKIEYTVLNAVTVHEDTAELYWQFFDDQNDTELKQVRVQITPPQTGVPGEMQVYGHGPLHGTTGITEDGAARLDVSPLRAGQLLEVRVLYPPEWSADSDRRSGEAALPRIESEERAYLAEAEAEREQRQADQRLAWQASLLVLLLNAIVIAVFYLLYGKKYPPQVTGASYDNLPGDIPPAMVAYLVQGRCTDGARSATLFDLVRRGYVSMKPLERKGERDEDTGSPSSESSYAYELDFEFELLRRGETPELHAYERMILDWLFPAERTSEPVRFSELLARRSGHGNGR